MPQVIAILFIIYVVIVWVIPLVIWIIQWIAAGIVWVWQVLLMPFFVYFTPAIIILVISMAIFFGGWIAVQNYFASLRIHINPPGSLEKPIKYYIISMLTLFLVTLYLSLAISSLWLSYQPGQQFVFHLVNYYQSITFPAFQIDFPFQKTVQNRQTIVRSNNTQIQFIQTYYQDINRRDVNSVIRKWKSPNKSKLRSLIRGSSFIFKINQIRVTKQTQLTTDVFVDVCAWSKKRAKERWVGTIRLETVKRQWKISKMYLSPRQRLVCSN